MDLEFYDAPQPFLDAAGVLLASDPVLGSVIASVSERTAREIAAGSDSWSADGKPFTRWWAIVRDDAGEVVSAAMRTAPFPPYPTFATVMTDAAAAALAAALFERGEFLGGANGALPGARVLAEETARLNDATLVMGKQSRLWEARTVEVPSAPAGALRRATEEDAELVLSWFRAFHAEADEQAGREPDPDAGDHNTLESVLVRIREGVEWLWELPGGEIAHLSGASLPAYGVSRIGPVYTPQEHRGRGLASHVVGELTRRGLDEGHRMCLFTDQANPISNKIYAGLGYEPVVDMAEHLVQRLDPSPGSGDAAPESGVQGTTRFIPMEAELLDRAVEACRSLIVQRFPGEEHAGAAAMVLGDGTVLTGTAPEVMNPSVEVCHELEPFCAAFRLDQPIVASVCLHRGPDGRVIVLSPCGVCRERLAVHGPDVKVGVADPRDVTAIVWKTLKDVLPDYWMTAFPDEVDSGWLA